MSLRSEEHHYCPHASLFIPPLDKWMWRGLSRYDPPRPDTAPPRPPSKRRSDPYVAPVFPVVWNASPVGITFALSSSPSVLSLLSPPPLLPPSVVPLRLEGGAETRETPPRIDANHEAAGQLGDQRGAAIVTFPSTRPVAEQRGGGTWASAGLRQAGGGGRRGPRRLVSSQALHPGPAPAESPGRVCGYPACFPHSEWTTPSVSMRAISLALTPHWSRVTIRVGPSAGQTVQKSFGGRTGSVRDPRCRRRTSPPMDAACVSTSCTSKIQRASFALQIAAAVRAGAVCAAVANKTAQTAQPTRG